jgi:hypothetical protein
MFNTTPLHASIKEICQRHRCSRSHLYDLMGLGKIVAVKSGKRTLVVVASADAHFNNLPPAQIKPSPQAKRRAMASVNATEAS